MKNYNRQIGAWLAYQRKAHNMSQDDVAVMMHVTKAAVSRWETGIRTIDASKMFLRHTSKNRINMRFSLCVIHF